MRAVTRLGGVLLAGAMWIAPSTSLAQQAEQPTVNTPAPSDSVGAPELRNFSLNGTVTRRADQPVEVPGAAPSRTTRPQSDAAAPPRTASAPAQQTGATTVDRAPASRTQTASPSRAAPTPVADAQPPATQSLRQSPPASSVTIALPTLRGAGEQGAASASAEPADAATFAPAPATGGGLGAAGVPSILPWLLAALAAALGGAFLFWRNRHREAFAGTPQIDAFEAPEPIAAPRAAPPAAPAPEPAAVPPRAAAPVGIVSTRLRPWLDIGFNPLRCILEQDRVTLDLELEVFNSGSAPARAVLVEASLLTAGPTQDDAIVRFFDNPVGAGERIVAIPPLQRIAVRTQVVASREHFQPYQLGGREVLVPLIAFNALYSWSGGEGQTSSSYLVGRNTKGEKLGPFPLNQGPKIFRGLAARLLPTGVRR